MKKLLERYWSYCITTTLSFARYWSYLDTLSQHAETAEGALTRGSQRDLTRDSLSPVSASNYCLGHFHDNFPFYEVGQAMKAIQSQKQW